MKLSLTNSWKLVSPQEVCVFTKDVILSHARLLIPEFGGSLFPKTSAVNVDSPIPTKRNNFKVSQRPSVTIIHCKWDVNCKIVVQYLSQNSKHESWAWRCTRLGGCFCDIKTEVPTRINGVFTLTETYSKTDTETDAVTSESRAYVLVFGAGSRQWKSWRVSLPMLIWCINTFFYVLPTLKANLGLILPRKSFNLSPLRNIVFFNFTGKEFLSALHKFKRNKVTL